ncbi:MAG: chemotaxis protein CheB [Thermoleophilia bacterium]|nr:chemotaxis protein CheB [Thermoleophilia bacterium]
MTAAATNLVCIGASWGGLDALRVVLAGLSAEFPAPICVVQHRGEEDGVTMLVDFLASVTTLAVCEAADKQPLMAGTVYVAPAGYHVLVNGGRIALSVEDRVRWSRPSVDVLFESAAADQGSGVTAVVLTGANDDGARGVRAVRAAGGTVIVQDPDSAERSEMPRAAIATGAPDAILPITAIAAELVRLGARGRERS